MRAGSELSGGLGRPRGPNRIASFAKEQGQDEQANYEREARVDDKNGPKLRWLALAINWCAMQIIDSSLDAPNLNKDSSCDTGQAETKHCDSRKAVEYLRQCHC